MDIVHKMLAPQEAASENGSETESNIESVKPAPKRTKSKRKASTSVKSEEVNLLRKEIEEMKFYQELEQTEYQEMKEKMHNYEKQMKEIGKNSKKKEESSRRPASSHAGTRETKSRSKQLHKIEEESEFADSNMDTIDLIAGNTRSSTPKRSSESDRILQKKLKKRDHQIQQLKTKLSEKVTSSKESSGKIKALAKEYEKRLTRMETLKDEEIDDIKEHYKQMMETLAKQVQKSGKRHQEELERNANLRSMMEEMRNDMTDREKNLESKIKVQLSTMKKNELKLTKTETKLDRTGSKYSSLKNELDETLKSNQEYSEKLASIEKSAEETEENLKKEIKENKEKYEHELKELRDAHERENTALRISVEEEISLLTTKMIDVEKLFDEEASEHDKTAARLRDLEDELRDREIEEEKLNEQITELEDKLKKTREELQEEINALEVSGTEKSAQHEEQLLKTAKERMSITNELKAANEKNLKIEQEIKQLTDDKIKKAKTMKKRVLEIDDLQFRLNTINEAHLKEVKLRDIEFVKAKKKWNINEQRMRAEIQEMREAQEKFDALQETASGTPVAERNIEEKKILESQKKLIEQLKADKASLQMAVASIRGKATKEITALEKELAKSRRALVSTAYERRLDKKIEIQHTADEERGHEELARSPAPESVPAPVQESHHNTNADDLVESNRTSFRDDEESEIHKEENYSRGHIESPHSESSSTESTVPVNNQPKKIQRLQESKRGLTAQKSYRNYVRNRKFSKKNVTVGNE
jgi:hypothetical protein